MPLSADPDDFSDVTATSDSKRIKLIFIKEIVNCQVAAVRFFPAVRFLSRGEPFFIYFFGHEEYRRITPAAQDGAAGSVRLLLTKNPARLLIVQFSGYVVSRFNGSRDSGRQLTRVRAPSLREPDALLCPEIIF